MKIKYKSCKPKKGLVMKNILLVNNIGRLTKILSVVNIPQYHEVNYNKTLPNWVGIWKLKRKKNDNRN